MQKKNIVRLQKKKYTKKEPLEHDTQVAFFRWVRTMAKLDKRFAYFFAVPNQGRNRRDAYWGNRRVAEGLESGVPDVLCLYPSSGFHGLAIEFKRAGKKPTKDQFKWLHQLNKANYAAGICHSFNQAMEIVKTYFGIKD